MTRTRDRETTGDSRPRGHGRAKEVSRFEWLAAVAGTLIVLAAVGFLLHDAIVPPTTPPDIAIEVDSIVEVRGGYLVEFRAVNTGYATASALVVEAELLDGEEVVASSEVTLDYVPEQAERAAGVFFTEDPRRHRLEIRPRGYEHP